MEDLTTGIMPASGTVMPENKSDRIRLLNDAMRRGVHGHWMITSGVEALGTERVNAAITAIRNFDSFDPDNDPYGEHDFGAISIGEDKLFWKIDYYDRSLSAGSPDPSNSEVTQRVLTIMLMQEY